jgi:hypothetical protein
VGCQRRNKALQGTFRWEETQLGLCCHCEGRSTVWSMWGAQRMLRGCVALLICGRSTGGSCHRKGVYRLKLVMSIHSVQCCCRCVVSVVTVLRRKVGLAIAPRHLQGYVPRKCAFTCHHSSTFFSRPPAKFTPIFYIILCSKKRDINALGGL